MKHGILYQKNEIPSFKCPSCNEGDMQPEGEANCREMSEYSTGGDTRVLLSTDLICNNHICAEVGSLVMQGEFYWDPEGGNEMLFTPIYAYPAPNIFPLSEKYPYKIRQLLVHAFTLFWVDSDSCGNKVRAALEELLTQLGIEQYQAKKGVPILSDKGHPKPISLQSRLREYSKKGKIACKCASALEAIKWLGNEASHSSGGVFQNTVYQSLMVFGAVLEQIYLCNPLPADLDYSVDNLNFFYSPHIQDVRPKKET
ncbi:DUF4145 domain-containing protein [Salinivibrio sharmensis]|uniref:DUF4145 domain-containing protein n=1 Tax=Salinivibrio sharmensis TaxID=390883 RepID=A0ABX3KBX5_9GAMM|nr:DUF4145 domain-containing protein [Salinivibrio sharmensis]OOE86436.1 hypothetical protein BZG74_12580 [Salinivibrio sharmensis]